MENKRTAKVMLAASMAIFGTLGPFTRRIAVGSGELALYRAVLAALMLTGMLAMTRQKLDLRAVKKELALLLVSGMAMGVNWVLLFQAYRYTTISAATLSYYFAPVLVTLACPLLFHEKLTRRQTLCFAMSTVGMALIIGVQRGGGADLLGVMLGLCAAVFYASVILMNKFIRGVEGLHRTLMQFLGAIAILLPYVLLAEGVHLSALDGAGWACLLVVGLVHTGLAYCLYFGALRSLRGQEAAILSYIDPLVAVLTSFFVLGEAMTLPQVIGGALVLGFTLYNEL